MKTAIVLALAAATAVSLAVQAQAPGAAAGVDPAVAAAIQNAFASRDQPLVDRYDSNGDGRLDAAERKLARAWLTGPAGPGSLPRIGNRAFEPTSRGRRLTAADVQPYPQTPLYDASTLRTVFLQFEAEDWEDELEAFYRTDVEVAATVVVDGRTYRDVGIGFRGASSFLMMTDGLKRSLNLSFDFVHDDQRIGGYRTLNLLNVNSDPTYVRAMLYAEIARHYLPALKANYVRVVINGESWGVYLNSQQYNSDFIREWFPAAGGARWKVPGRGTGQGGLSYLGENVAEYKRWYDIRTRDDPKPWVNLIRLTRVLNETPLDKLEAALDPLLDIDGALKFLALDVALVNTDGYWRRHSDYNLYEDARGRFHVIPHDMNEAFLHGTTGTEPRVRIDPLVGLDDSTKPLRSKLLAVPALRARYLAYIRDIAQRWLDWNTLEPLVRQYQAVIAGEVKLETHKLYSFDAFQSDVSASPQSLKSFVDQRRAYLLQAVR